MAIVFKVDVLAALKEAGYNTSRIRNDRIMGEAMLQKLRKNELPSWAVFDTLCSLLDCQPADLIEHIEDKQVRAILREKNFKNSKL